MTAGVSVGRTDDTAHALLRQLLIISALGVALLLLVVAFAYTQRPPAPRTPVDGYVQAHQPDHGSVHLAYVQVVVAGAVALLALAHAARVVAYVFRRKDS